MENGITQSNGSMMVASDSVEPDVDTCEEAMSLDSSYMAQSEIDDRVQIAGVPLGQQSVDSTITTEAPGKGQQPNVFASAVLLYMRSPKHKHLFLADLEWRLLPALSLKQFRLFTKGNQPIGLATWAMVSEEVAERLKSDVSRIKPSDWRSGDRPVLVDLVAPFGGEKEMAQNLTHMFKKT